MIRPGGMCSHFPFASTQRPAQLLSRLATALGFFPLRLVPIRSVQSAFLFYPGATFPFPSSMFHGNLNIRPSYSFLHTRLMGKRSDMHGQICIHPSNCRIVDVGSHGSSHVIKSNSPTTSAIAGGAEQTPDDLQKLNDRMHTERSFGSLLDG